MITQTVTVLLGQGLHARPAARFAALAGSFEAELTLAYGGRMCDPKSIVKLLTLAVGRGATVELRADGPDEEEALRALCEFVQNPTE